MSQIIQMKEVIYVDRRKSQICMNDGKWVTYRKLFKFEGRDWAICEGQGYWVICGPTESSGRYVEMTMIPPAGVLALSELVEAYLSNG